MRVAGKSFSLRSGFNGILRFWEDVSERNVGLVAAGIAFYALLAIFPGVAALVAVWGLMSDPMVVETQLDLMREFLPDEAFSLLTGQVDRLVSTHERALGLTTIVSMGVTLWSARLGVGAMIMGLNVVHGVPHRSGLGHAVMAIVLTVALIGVAVVALITVVVLPLVLAFFPLGGLAFWVLRVANWLVVLAVVAGGVALVYRFGPNLSPRVRWLSPGLWLAVGLWVAASLGFSWYMAHFGDYGAVYGSLGAVVALLMWFYISAFAVLLGAVLNARMHPAEAVADPEDATGAETPAQ